MRLLRFGLRLTRPAAGTHGGFVYEAVSMNEDVLGMAMRPVPLSEAKSE